MGTAFAERLRRWTAWAGGPLGLLAILVVEMALVALLVVDARIPLALVAGAAAVLFVLDRPIYGVIALIAARLLSTGSLVFFRIGRLGIGPFEPALLFALGALVHHAAARGLRLWRPWPWRAPYLALAGWIALSVAWSVNRRDGISELPPMALVVADAVVILAFVRSWTDFRRVLQAWVLTCVLIGVLTLTTDALGIRTDAVTFKAAAGGGRETGLGQQPNWYAMNLMFIIHSSFGLALLERRTLRRVGWAAAGFFVLTMMLKSGSRGGAYATLIGAGLMAMGNPLFRRWFLRVGGGAAALFVVGIGFDVLGSAKALLRIASNVSLQQNYRQLNWEVCVAMFRDTWGRGIGAGGYEDLLPRYNNYVAQSLYDYPHGIFWQLLAHYGVVGLSLAAWLVLAIVRMARRTTEAARGTEAEVFAWTMPAAMLGYAAWSFLEFTLNDKPFWEFLALYTALHLLAERYRRGELEIPRWEGRIGGRSA